MSDVDAACDHALACTKVAQQTHDPAHHQVAKQAHEVAHAAATAAGRPSLAQSHLQLAAGHDQSADPTTPSGKGEVAHNLTLKARQPGSKPEAHDAAAQAHQDASQAHHDAGNVKQSNNHSMIASDHQSAASRMRQPPPPRNDAGGPARPW